MCLGLNHDQVLALAGRLRDLDNATVYGELFGDSECPWFYWRETIEKAMGLPPGFLETGDSRFVEDFHTGDDGEVPTPPAPQLPDGWVGVPS